MNPVAVSGLSPLEILGLKPGATAAEVKAAFRRIAQVLHPDVCPWGQALLLVASSAKECATSGRGWAAPLPPHPAPFEAPGPRKRPSAPRKTRQSKSPRGWHVTAKGNYTRKHPCGAFITVFHKGDRWGWVGPDVQVPTASQFSTETFESAEDAMSDAAAHFGL